MHRLTICCLLVCFLGAARAQEAVPGERRPNIVLILVDDLGWRDLGCQGGDYYRTPAIDSLAREGLRFTDAYAAAAVCSPTRAGLHAGQYPARLRITDWIPGVEYPFARLKIPSMRMALPLETTTLAERLKAAGYRTFHVGKWHLGTEPFWPEHQGFDVNVGGNDKGQPGSYFHPYAKKTRAGDWTVRPLPPGGRKGDYLTDRLTSEALKLIASAGRQPFFLSFSTYTVHSPYQAPDADVARERGRRLPGERHAHAVYSAMVSSLDHNVGRILETLRERGLERDTLVVFTSDNGGVHRISSQEPLRAGKGLLYEGGIRVPLIVRWPGRVAAGASTHAPAITMDLYPTLLAAAGVPQSAGGTQPCDGVELQPLWKQPAKPLAERPLFWHYPHYHTPRRPPCGAVRAGRWKLLEWYEDGRLELYDLQADVGETRDLSTAHPDVAADLRKRLHAWLNAVGAQRNLPNPAFDAARPFRDARSQFRD